MKHKQVFVYMAFVGMLLLTSCSNIPDITQAFPFTVETMPVPKEVAIGETVEIRCTLTSEGNYAGAKYTIRYFQYDGVGILRMGETGKPFVPNDRYPVERGDFRLYYTSQSTEQQNLEIVFEDNFGQSQILEFGFTGKRDDTETGE